MKTPHIPENVRRVLCIFPTYAPSFGTFSHAYRLVGASAFMPPQGLMVIANYLPASWQVRLVDENICGASRADIEWADSVFVTGMHIQANQIHEICARAKASGKLTVLGGPSVSAAPGDYPDYDYLHIGELGDATDRLIEQLDRCVRPPPAQQRFETSIRLPLSAFPIPAYHLVPLHRYLLGTLQFSSGCPYQCEFCDIPNLYGRQPRLKTPAQLVSELDHIVSQDSFPSTLYFVDDNFIGNRRAAREMLPHLIAWQERNGYPLTFACEATLNIAAQEPILALMRRARFDSIFVGIETPELESLAAIRKSHNATIPMMDAIAKINSYGLEVTSGIILGFDSDGPQTESRLKDFIDASQVPMLTINLLQALPRTALWDRLQASSRLRFSKDRESNVEYLRPYEEVIATWRRCVEYAYEPRRLFQRFIHQIERTYANRFRAPAEGRLTWANALRGLILIVNLLWRLGLLADYRRDFWRVVWQAFKLRQFESIFGIGFISYHLIEFSREALRGEQNASFYSSRSRSPQ